MTENIKYSPFILEVKNLKMIILECSSPQKMESMVLHTYSVLCRCYGDLHSYNNRPDKIFIFIDDRDADREETT